MREKVADFFFFLSVQSDYSGACFSSLFLSESSESSPLDELITARLFQCSVHHTLHPTTFATTNAHSHHHLGNVTWALLARIYWVKCSELVWDTYYFCNCFCFLLLLLLSFSFSPTQYRGLTLLTLVIQFTLVAIFGTATVDSRSSGSGNGNDVCKSRPAAAGDCC